MLWNKCYKLVMLAKGDLQLTFALAFLSFATQSDKLLK
jgi:hypothetical protein